MKKMCFLAFFALCLLSAPTKVWGELTWTWNSTTQTMTISGSGAMKNYTIASGNQSPAYNRSDIKTVIIEEGVTSIGAYAFYNCSALVSITVPASVTNCGDKAFYGCKALKEVHAASPDAWASITFDTSVSGRYALPFYESTGGSSGTPSTECKFYFGNSSTAASTITFTPDLTEIKPYTFYRAGSISDVNLPASINKVGKYAFDCKITRLTTNRTTPATTEENAFTFISGTNVDTYLYLPQGATSAYKTTPWYNGTGTTSDGARWCGYSQDTKKTQSDVPVSGRYVYPTSGTIGGINWSLSTAGVLTFTGTGELPAFDATYNSNDCIPWYRFRYLVYKAVIGTESSSITSIKNALKWCYALTSVDIKQSSLPEVTEMPTSDFLGDVVEISVPMADLSAEALTQEPWKSMEIKLSEPLVIDETKKISTWSGYDKLAGDEVEQLNIIRSLSTAYYNTFCSPISFDATQVTEIFGTNTDIRKLESSSYDPSKNELILIFSETSLNTIEAGVPYIIQPAQNVNGILLTNVATSRLTTDPQTISTDYADFYGILEPYKLSAADPTFLFLAADNQLMWGDEGTLKGMRAYFKIKGISDIQQASMVPARMQFGSKTISTDLETVSNAQGTMRNGKYMYNGHLVIVHNGKKYNL